MIKPLEKDNKKELIFLKISFIITFLVAGILIDRLFLSKRPQDNFQILGSEEKIIKTKDKPKANFLKQVLNNAERKIEDVGGQALGEATEFIQNTQEKIASSVSDLIYKTSIEPVIKQIKKLPYDQQEKIKKDLCD